MQIFTKQMLEAAAWTALETFIVTIGPAIAIVPDGNWAGLTGPALSALMAAAAAGLSIIKSAAVKNIGAQDSPFISGGAEG